MGMIEEAIKNYWGERCPDYDADCVVCQAWASVDHLDVCRRICKTHRRRTMNMMTDS